MKWENIGQIGNVGNVKNMNLEVIQEIWKIGNEKILRKLEV